MPVIVAYGDSNTWGYDPAAGAPLSRRHALDRRDARRRWAPISA